jgi:hypothetical protein
MRRASGRSRCIHLQQSVCRRYLRQAARQTGPSFSFRAHEYGRERLHKLSALEVANATGLIVFVLVLLVSLVLLVPTALALGIYIADGGRFYW